MVNREQRCRPVDIAARIATSSAVDMVGDCSYFACSVG
jgi:hypothetical protein